MHPNLKLLSFSSVQLFHNCPRKFQLYRLLRPELAKKREPDIHTDFGALVGWGCQLYLEGRNQQDVWSRMLTTYQRELEEDIENTGGRANKSFYHALHAVDKFHTQLEAEELQQWELVKYPVQAFTDIDTTIPAVELSFRVDCGDGFFFRGKLDALLRHKVSRRFAVMETKTTSGRIHEAMYRNSSQGIGYSLIVDAIASRLNEDVTDKPYDIIYPVYNTKSMDWTIFNFPKTAVARALWIQDLVLDITKLKEYGMNNYFPMYGNNCYSFFRECEHFGECDMSQEYLFGSLEDIAILEEITDPPPVDFEFTLQELIDVQLSKLTAGD